MIDVDAALQAQIRNIEQAYGHPVTHWFAVIDASGLTKHTEVVAMLKSGYGLKHAAAHRLSLLARDRVAAVTGAGPSLDDLYAGRKSALRPIHDQLMSAVGALGEDVAVAPKKGYLSLRRRKQFAMIQPSTATRIDVGLILPPGTGSTERLEPAGTWNALFTHRVRVTKATEIDAELGQWLRAAYSAAE